MPFLSGLHNFDAGLAFGIGQGFVQMTPLQMAMIYGAIASGKIYKPYVVSEVADRNGEIIYERKPESLGDAPVSSDNIRVIRDALREVVKRATGVAAKVSGLPAAGKTGTAQNPGRPHAWFACYAPYDNPEIVVVAFVAHGEAGDRISAYVARDILKWYKENRLTATYTDGPEEGRYILHGRAKVYYSSPTADEGAQNSAEQ